MLLFYVRHGDPTYDPDALTPLGHRQAEAVGKRLALFGVDKIYASTSNRAIQTSQPACEMMKKQVELLDFCNENHAWQEFVVDRDGVRRWIFHDREMRELFCSEEVTALGHRWYEHPELTAYKAGVERVRRDCDEFLLGLGYEHIGHTGRYKIVKPNDERVALFAHQGFSMAFFSTILDIPYPVFATRFDLCHTGLSAIDFREENGYAIPRVLTHSSDAHLYRDGLPTFYNGEYRF